MASARGWMVPSVTVAMMTSGQGGPIHVGLMEDPTGALWSLPFFYLIVGGFDLGENWALSGRMYVGKGCLAHIRSRERTSEMCRAMRGRLVGHNRGGL